MSKDIADNVEIEETSQDNSKRMRTPEAWNHFKRIKVEEDILYLQPWFNMISKNTLKGDILKIYKDERTKYYNLLEKLKCRFAITTDMWTSSNNNKGFMAMIAHFSDDNWILELHFEVHMFQLYIQHKC
ncbi:hypothetical protein Sango_1591600 [Sesamum angolense]|uniref:Uncharacterized protein n=1 Tax=Sesamum angolense TaxID=2727404 RepID=A0AAE2BU11_9LAMI|nr:hypothetical protein Sango_1591600 [Sesamum angolense]